MVACPFLFYTGRTDGWYVVRSHMQSVCVCVYNLENPGTKIQHKTFILNCCIEGLKQLDPENIHVYVYDPQVSSPQLMSPSAMATPPADRFVCRKEKPASIGLSRKYK